MKLESLRQTAGRAIKPAILATACLTIGFTAGSALEPAWAGKTLIEPVIDQDLEQALKNHFQKRFFNLIEATDAQKSKISALIEDQLDFARPLRGQMREKAMTIADDLASDSIDREALKSKIESIKAIKEKIAAHRLDTILSVAETLTPEQRQVVSARIKARLTGIPVH